MFHDNLYLNGKLNDATPDAFNLLELSKLFNVTTDYLLYDDYKSDDDIPRVKRGYE